MSYMMAMFPLWKKYFWEDLEFTTLLHPVPFFLAILIILLSLYFSFVHYKSSRGKLNLPPSPPRLPILGNLHQLGQLPHHSLRELSDKYGPLMFLNLGQIPVLVISSSDLVAEIANTHDVIFSSRPKTMATDMLVYKNNDIGFAPYGKYWRQARKICVGQLLSLKRVQSFQFVREEEVETLVNRICKACLISGTKINLSEMIAEASNSIMLRCILGQSYKEEDGSRSRLGELLKELAIQLMAFSVGDFFPSLWWIDFLSGFIGRLRSLSKELDAFSDRLIQEHETVLKSPNYDGSGTKDFVDVLLSISQDQTSGFEFTRDQLKGIILDLFLGGIGTSSALAEWLMTELLRHPRVMKKAQEEVRRVVGEKAKVDMNDINQMEYPKYIMKETMRLHPPAPLLAPRETTVRVQIRGYDIPTKTTVLINAWAIHRHPNLWERPEEFIPERFENNPIDFGSKDFQLIPFGFGRRACPGLAFGISNVEYLIANLLYWFDWKLADGILPQNLDMSEVYGLTLRKKIPLEVVPRLHSP